MVKEWREALKTSCDRCGWDLKNKKQYEEIENVVEKVNDILGRNQIWSFGDDLVDMHSRVEELEELLDLSANDIVRIVGICGMGGIGKTTVATSLFKKISPQYNARCYIDDLSKIYCNFGATSAQKQLLSQALNEIKNMEIHNVFHGTMLIRTRLRHLKMLVVLDNVDEVEQLEKLGLRPEYLGAGSRLIIISRDCHILQNYGVNEVYNVEVLDETQALQLFCKKAFKSHDIPKEYKELTLEALKYANGLPLAIKVLGSFLHDRDVCEWRSALARMNENPSKDIMDVLRISFDSLENLEKEIFLDIACFFSNRNGYSWKPTVKRLLEYRQFYPDIGMKVLIEKSLISCQNKEIEMHDLLKELGKNIVREKAPKEPSKWSRLWSYKDFQKVMKLNKEAKNVEAIVIQQNENEFVQERIRVDALSKMGHLELLSLNNVKCFGTLDYISNELRYLYWDPFPWMSLPSTFHLDQLVELILPRSNIKQLWKGKKCVPNLTKLDLNHSKNLIEVPDLSEVPLLMDLNLEGCIKLVQIHPSIGILRQLRHLRLRNCKNLIEVPNLSEVERLTDLTLEGCIEVVHIDSSIGNLRQLIYLNLKNCKNLVLNLNILSGITSLRTLILSGCSNLHNSKMLRDSKVKKLLMSPFDFLYRPKPQDSCGLSWSLLSFSVPCLVYLDISFCSLLQIPDEIGNLSSLIILNLGGNKFVTLPNTIKRLSNLHCLNLEHCKRLEYLPELPTVKERFIDEDMSLYIFDCPKLRDMEHCYSTVFSWMMQNLQIYFNQVYLEPGMEIVIPGSEIPKWFNKQNASTSISMDPSDVIDDPNWIGVAICVLFVTQQDPMNLDENPCPLSTIQYWVDDDWLSTIPIYFEKDLVTVELDHLCIVFHSRKQFIHRLNIFPNTMHDLHEFEFECFIHNPKGLRVVVKNCGYRWVFEEDLQQLNSNIFFSGNSSSPKRKLLTSN
ncbi:maintenance of ploidy protein MOB1 [Vigna unguiculata]|uniref:ADP-ribosyl cyclase/cyclic ADP-ribose hydrolase n=1 Tax=Vigna unguiculata TaxID=3917 RepID=A0A4D6LFZ3_VIGUN|nr:maintenance of ploidy protein MOB1 [Vigna unguiculata]